jgi:hypothetical protein
MDGTVGATYQLATATILSFLVTDHVIIGGGGANATLRPVVYSKAHAANYAITVASLKTHWGTHRSRSSIGKPDTVLI